MYSDLEYLGNLQNFTGPIHLVPVITANGMIENLHGLNVEVQMETEDGEPWGRSFIEAAVLRIATPDVARLSGGALRHMFYMGSGPAYDVVALAETKGGMLSLLV